MKTSLDDHSETIVSFGTGCLRALAVVLILLAGSCAFVRISGAQEIRADLPPQLEPSLLMNVDVCSHVFGGYSYVVRISPDAVKSLNQGGQAWLAQPHGHPVERGKEAPWRSAEGLKSGPDFPPHGLLCLETREVNGQRIRDHISRKGSYYRSYHPRQADYVIPSLGVVVGGFDP